MKHPKRHPRSRHRRRRHPPGTAPGTVAVDPEATPTQIRVMAYGPDRVREDSAVSIATLRERRGEDPVLWVQVEGLGDAPTLAAVTEIFGLHPLAMEDVVNVGQRPKVDDYVGHTFVFLRMPGPDETRPTEQIALALGPGFVVTFIEDPGDCLNPVRERIRRAGKRIRSSGSDYLAYAILDTVVDAFFPVLEKFSERLVDLEQRLVAGEPPVPPGELYGVNRDLLSLRSGIRPLREMLGSLLRADSPVIGEKTRVYLRDVYDHAIELMDLQEMNRDLSSSLIDLHRANLTIRLNEIMKVLTLISTIFIPVTFIAGIYGMNFRHMPELEWSWGYPFSLVLMGAVIAAMLIYFRKKHWLE